MGTGRLILNQAEAGDWNMAVDEALMASSAASSSVILRLYRWAPATVSLGYFQSIDDRQQHAASRSCPVVRRHSGGGAIVHDHELTYGLVVPLQDRKRGENAEIYRTVHDAIIEWLNKFGVAASRFAESEAGRENTASCDQATQDRPPFLCFQRRSPDDLVFHQEKVLGSAQRRGFGALLQHGSLLFHASQAAPELPGICDLARQPMLLDHLDDDLASGLAKRIGRALEIEWTRSSLSEHEIESAESIRVAKFGGKAWTLKR